MALKVQPVVADSGSEELRALKASYNALLTQIAAAASFAALQTALDVAATPSTAVVSIDSMPGIPAPRRFASR